MPIGVFSKIKWLALQGPLIMVAAMVTGRNITEILRLNVHERLVLLREVFVQVLELVSSAANATAPDSPDGVALTEEELEAIIDEADDIKPAGQAVLDSFKAKAP